MSANQISALKKENFRKSINDQRTDLFFLTNDHLEVALTNYGARLVALFVRDQQNHPVDIVLGFDNIDDYIADKDYQGATVGRYANRIAKGLFTVEGKEYRLATNNGPNHLHGGISGFNKAIWKVQQQNPEKITMTHTSPDGDEGYPGNLKVTVDYELNENSLHIKFHATTDKTTVVNLTNHAYFNLNGQGSGSILEHALTIHADYFTPTDASSIPTGILDPVEGTPFDFRKEKTIGRDIDSEDQQLIFGNGYDHNFVLNKDGENPLSFAARVKGDQSGIVMEIYTEEPGIQLYTGNYLESLHRLKYGRTDERRSAFCLETQHFPDAPNQPAFPSTTLKAGEVYKTETRLRFPPL